MISFPALPAPSSLRAGAGLRGIREEPDAIEAGGKTATVIPISAPFGMDERVGIAGITALASEDSQAVPVKPSKQRHDVSILVSSSTRSKLLV
jgi:hypothetical protein